MSQATPTSAAQPLPASQAPAVQRQFVSFGFYRLDPAFRRLPQTEREQAREEFNALFAKPHPGMICLTYSTVALKAETDFLLWRISLSADDFQTHAQAMNRTRFGAYLTQPYSFLSMTKRSMYIDKLDPYHTAESRTHLMPLEKRQEIMDVHIRVGNEFPSVKLNTTYSFGLDDQEFVVAFETEEPKDFLDLVMKLRETNSSKYTLRDTPIFTCIQMPMDKILQQLF